MSHAASEQTHPPIQGKIALVGAGPGNPYYITLRGAQCLAEANVILYDYLVNPALLEHASYSAELICLGQHGKSRLWSQTEINNAMVAYAQAGKYVVRLKSGDPTIFGRLAEEMQAILEHGIPYEIVPGITAALAAGSCAGVPLTHRDMSSAVALVTGHEEEGKIESALDFQALAKFPGTLVFYMGVTTVEKWSTALLTAGKSETTPVAIIRRCSFNDQKTILTTLGNVAQAMQHPAKIRPPVIIVVGDVAPLSQEYAWYEQRPCFGRKVLVTRAEHQASALRQPLEQLGAEVILQPTIEILPPENWEQVDAYISRLHEFDWLVFSSVNGVHFFLKRLLATKQDLRTLGNVKLAAIGPATAQALESYYLRADIIPSTEYRAEALAAELVADASEKRFLLLRANRGREVLADTLSQQGAKVEQVIVYRSVDTPSPAPHILEQMQRGEIDWVTVTSSAIANSLSQMFGNALRNTKLASISPITSQTLLKLGYVVAAEATEYTMPGLVAALKQWENAHTTE